MKPQYSEKVANVKEAKVKLSFEYDWLWNLPNKAYFTLDIFDRALFCVPQAFQQVYQQTLQQFGF